MSVQCLDGPELCIVLRPISSLKHRQRLGLWLLNIASHHPAHGCCGPWRHTSVVLHALLAASVALYIAAAVTVLVDCGTPVFSKLWHIFNNTSTPA